MIPTHSYRRTQALRVLLVALLFTAATAVAPSPVTQHARATEGGALLPSFPWISATWDEDYLHLRMDGLQAGSYELYELDEPPRIVVDIPGLTCDAPVNESFDFASVPLLNQLRASCTGEGVRVVLESRYALYWEMISPEDGSGVEILCYLRFHQTVEEMQIDPGTKYMARRYVTPSGQRFAHIVVSDPALSRLRPRVFLASDVTTRSLASIEDIVVGSRSAVGVNGGYFQWPGISLSLVMQYGEVRFPPQLHRPAFMILEDGSYAMGYPPISATVKSASGLEWDADLINQAPGPGRIALLTPGHPERIRNGMTGTIALIRDGVVENITSDAEEIEDFADCTVLWSRQAYLPLELLGIGETVEVSYVVNNGSSPIMHALQGGPFLLQNGRVNITSEEDDIGRDIANGRAARTGVGIDEGGRVYLVVVEGPGGGRSMGASLQELAWTLLELGATWAINLDGGSSTGLAFGFTNPDTVLPRGGRQIATALVLIDESGRMQGESFFF